MKTTERYAHLSADHLAGVRDIIKPNIGTKAEVINLGIQRTQNEFTHKHQLCDLEKL